MEGGRSDRARRGSRRLRELGRGERPVTRYDVIVVGAGVAGSLVAHRLGRHSRRVLVLEAGTADSGARAADPDPLTAGLTASGRLPGSLHRPHPAARWPETADLAGTGGTPGFRADGATSRVRRPRPVQEHTTWRSRLRGVGHPPVRGRRSPR
ncbi:FAD-dependent oxidoreductase [Streptomyces sp. NK15101]|uniref:FAD-dependent oxidoreductase n=1 Tax=Streptomyces sp. NK15101 TaxID=2873261 RepID=UPI001CEC7357|nr:FAD-dependent oxidoreductase [Streptomyces sp. NK15101]